MYLTAVVICHKLEHLVDRAIASIVTQTRQPDELILLGTDCRQETVDALAHWDRRPVRAKGMAVFVEHAPEPLTCTQSKNYAAAHLPEWTDAFFTLDADDWIHPNFIHKLMWFMEHAKRPPDVVGCDYQTMDVEGFVRPSAYNNSPIDDLVKYNVLPSCSIIRKQAFLDVGPYDEELIFEDWGMWARMYAAGKHLARYPQTLFTYMRHATNKTNTDNAALANEQIKALWQKLNRAQTQGDETRQAHPA